MAGWQTRSFSGVVREKECGFWRTAKPFPPPPPKGECLECASVTLLRPASRWRGDTEGERGRNGDEVHGADAFFVVGFGRKY
jgi:hypothetical protein